MYLTEEVKSEMYMNSIIVHFVQLIFIGCIWKYAFDTETFIIFPSKSPDLMVARFMGALMMHINVERDVRCGIDMMKFSVNHYKSFTNVYAAFSIALMWTIISFIIELNCMVIMGTLGNIIDVIMKYVSLAAISKIPRFYYNSL